MGAVGTAKFRNATIEKEVFSQGSRISLSPKMPGIKAFKSRLSIILKDQIVSKLPKLLRDVEANIGNL